MVFEKLIKIVGTEKSILTTTLQVYLVHTA